MRCSALDKRLSALADDDLGLLDGDLGVHVGRCVRCQAEVARYRRLHAELKNLRGGPVAADDELFADIVRHIDTPGGRRSAAHRPHRSTRTAATATACTVLAAAGAAGAIVAVGHLRNRRVAH